MQARGPFPPTQLIHNEFSSTLIGVLTRGKLDDGRGLVRADVFTHKHEQETGRTSAISHQILGFNAEGVRRFKSLYLPSHFNRLVSITFQVMPITEFSHGEISFSSLTK